MNATYLRRIARKHNAPVVLVAHKNTPHVQSMMGGRLPESYEAAVEAAEQMIASGHFVTATIIKPTGEAMLRVPGLDGVYAEDTDL